MDDAPNCLLVTPQDEINVINLHRYMNQGKRNTDYIKTLTPDTSYTPAGVHTFRIQKICDLILEWIDEDRDAQYFYGDQCLGNCRDISQLPTTLINNLYVRSTSPKIKIKCRLVPVEARDALIKSYSEFVDTKNGLVFYGGDVVKYEPKVV